MKYVLLAMIFISLMQPAFSQYDPGKIDKKAVALYNQAMQRAEDGNLTNATGLLLQSIAIDKNYVDAYLSVASLYGKLRNYRTSTEYFEKAFALDSNYTIEYKLPYSINEAGLGEFSKALNAINELLQRKPPKNSTSLRNAETRKKSYEFAVEFEKKNGAAYAFAPKNLGKEINSSESEYFPCLSIDGKEIVFTRKLGNVNEDFFHSRKDSGAWEKPAPMEGNVNTDQNEGAFNISQDGQWLVFTGCLRAGGFGGCDLYISYLTPQGWSEAKNMGSQVNSDQWESQPCLSPDKKDLYFASRRFGGYGGSDIYISHLQTGGNWSEPVNLGPGINTAGDEQCPFIHADNQTLYFTSNTWQGYGDDDIFYTKKNTGDPDTSWTTPVNLGYPINTIDKEGTLYIAADGKTAYYASDKSDSKGGLDIYSFDLPEKIRPNKTLWVKGKVFDGKTSKGLPSQVELTDLATQKSFSKVQTDEEGNFLITLPLGRDYAFNVNHKGYLFYSDHFLLANSSPDSTYQKNIALQPIEVNASVVLNNIFFDTNKFGLKGASTSELDKVIQLLNENPTVRIQIEGHTDNAGTPADNLTLSNNRAKAVVAYLVS
ncbi:MAG TPA: OmpA family protein, partial [Chitinophagaceae bacterium]|nr:OmpA family protein [Chitinophagaceae bacterium]